jgi:hypothetical protein
MQDHLTNCLMLPYQPLSEIRFSLSAADGHLVAMGNEMVGIVHPCKIYSAMAVGRPILCLRPTSCHMADIVNEHGLGWRIRHGDVDQAVSTIEKILDTDPGELRRIGQQAMAVAKGRFGKALLCRRFVDVVRPTHHREKR